MYLYEIFRLPVDSLVSHGKPKCLNAFSWVHCPVPRDFDYAQLSACAYIENKTTQKQAQTQR